LGYSINAANTKVFKEALTNTLSLRDRRCGLLLLLVTVIRTIYW
jgi:hypothetical protein